MASIFPRGCTARFLFCGSSTFSCEEVDMVVLIFVGLIVVGAMAFGL